MKLGWDAIMLLYIGGINLLWILTYLWRSRTKERPRKYANKWIESRSRSDRP